MSIQSEINRISQNVADSLTAVAAKGVTVPTGSTSDDLPELISQISSGSGSAITITDETDEHGGTIRTITAVSLAGDTVRPNVLLNGYTAHNALGEAIVGTASGGGSPTLQAKTHIEPTESSQTITADTGYDGLSSVQIDPIDSEYVGSDITRRSSSDLTASGATVTVPSGYYSSQATKSVSSGSATAPATISGTSATVSTGTNTLTLTKTVSVTPSVTAGYVSSGTAGNASVSLTASVNTRSSSSLTVSGATVTAPSGYYGSNASASVASGSAGTPTATKGTVSNHSVSITPSVTNTTGYITGSTKTGTAVTVSASELVSGSETKTANGTYDVTNLAELVVNVASTSKNTQVVQGTTRTTSSTLTAIGAELTVSKTGTYDVYWSAFRSSTSSQYTFATQLYIAGTAYGSENTTWSNHVQNVHLSNVSLTASQKIRVYGRESRGSSYYIYAPTLVIVEV